jgi:steroid delta-isomerase-like uncharacterized protein
MTDELRKIAQDYADAWDVATPREVAERLFAEDVVDHDPQPGQGAGSAGMRQAIALYHAVFPDLHLSTDDVLVDGDRAAVRWTATGTHEGDELGVPATHRRVTMTGIDIIRVRDGRIVERWGEFNGLDTMRQITG